MNCLKLSPAEYWKAANRAVHLFAASKTDAPSTKGLLCKLDGYEIYLDNDAPNPNPDWDTVDALLVARGV